MSTKIRGVLFDKDGTLFDFRRTWEAWAQTFLVQIAPEPDMVELLGVAIGFDTQRGRFATDSVVIAGTNQDVAEALEPLVPGLSLTDLVSLMNRTAAQTPQRPAVPLVPLLQALRTRGLTLGVATNDAEEPAQAHLEDTGILDLFDFVAGYDSGYGAKPEPGQLLAFSETIGRAPASCVMVGDSLHDLRAGRAAGFQTVGVLTGMATPAMLEDFADAILPDIGHLPTWLQGRA